jgi:Uma2 family endonuclease
VSAHPITKGRRTARRGEPVWDIARFYPLQGDWTEEDYLQFEHSSGNQLVELVDGFIEVLPLPDPYLQRIVRYVSHQMQNHVAAHAEGEILESPMPVRLWSGRMREPDIGYFKPHRIPDPHKPPRGADLLVEVVSPGEKNRERDLEVKRVEYAKAKVGEYWIIDPKEKCITVLFLSGRSYRVHGVFRPSDIATSRLLPGFEIDVADMFAAANKKNARP